MSITWKDATTYSQSETERIPRAWAAEVGPYKVWIETDHIYYRGTWIIQCPPWFKERALNGIAPADHEQAKQIALSLVKDQLIRLQRQIAAVLPELEEQAQ